MNKPTTKDGIEIKILTESVGDCCKRLRRDLKKMMSGMVSITVSELAMQSLLFKLDRAVRENQRLVKLLRKYL